MAFDEYGKISVRQRWHNTLKVSRMIHELDSWWFLLAAAVAALDELVQYMVLLLSAWALTQSTIHTDYHPLIGKLVLFIAVILAGRVCVGILTREVATRQEALTSRFQAMLSEKIMEMDFCVADSPTLRKLRDRIRKDNNFGQGIYSFCWFYNHLFVNFFKIVWAVIIVIPVLRVVWQQRNLAAVGLFLLAILFTAFFSGLWMKEEKEYRRKRMNDLFDTPEEMAQKIAIARALYKNAPFILLDEPTAALDPKAEYEIYSSFDKMVGNKTAIYISHRLSSCRFCDDIAVFDGGRLVQRGNHDELVQDENGKYFELWSAQAQYYR